MTDPTLAAQIEALALIRRRSIQKVGAGISTRNWHTVENAYNEARDAIDKMLRDLPAIVTALRQAEGCTAKPDHADILETIENAADDWQKNGYTSALAEVRGMANVGRSLMEALPKGYCYMDSPAEIVVDLQNERDDALALRQAEAYPEHIGDLHLGDRRSDGERLCSHSHPVAESHPLYWPQLTSQYDDSDPFCLEHAIERQIDRNSGYPETLRQAEAAPGVVEALINLRDKANSVLTAMDKYNSDNGTHLGGAPFFGLGRAIAKADTALNGNASEQHGLGPSAVEIDNDGLKPLHVLVGSMVYIQQGDQLIVMDATAACDALNLARQHGAREGMVLVPRVTFAAARDAVPDGDYRNVVGLNWLGGWMAAHRHLGVILPAAPATDVGEG